MAILLRDNSMRFIIKGVIHRQSSDGMAKAFNRIAAGLEEAQAIARGEQEPATLSFMHQEYFIRAVWDYDANVWTATCHALPGLVAEASSLDVLNNKLPRMIRDLRARA
jgi:hypothetical protein